MPVVVVCAQASVREAKLAGASPLRLLAHPLYYRPLLAGLSLMLLQQVRASLRRGWALRRRHRLLLHPSCDCVLLVVVPVQVTGEPAIMYFSTGILRDVGVMDGQGEPSLTCAALRGTVPQPGRVDRHTTMQQGA